MKDDNDSSISVNIEWRWVAIALFSFTAWCVAEIYTIYTASSAGAVETSSKNRSDISELKTEIAKFKAGINEGQRHILESLARLEAELSRDRCYGHQCQQFTAQLEDHEKRIRALER